MALLELSLAVARVMFVYDFRLAEGGGELGRDGVGGRRRRAQEREFRLFTTVTSLCRGPWVVFRERERWSGRGGVVS